MQGETTQNLEQNSAHGILDTIKGAQTQSGISSFEPIRLLNSLISLLKERDQNIVRCRFGLNGNKVETLESIGKKYNLTRERVRQIEKDSLKFLRLKKLPELESALQLVFDSIVEHGNIIAGDYLIQTLLVNQGNYQEEQAVRFLLTLGDQFKFLKETPNYHSAWCVVGFDPERLNQVTQQFIDILKNEGHVLKQSLFYGKFKGSDYYQQQGSFLSDKVLESYLNLTKAIRLNPFGEIGLKDWVEVKPRDVGDKACLVLKHHGKPEHYSVITQMINNHKFDNRVAYKETVHNELIKDNRFVLVGRGIYALSEWGYKKGVVADVIKEILRSANKPLSRDEIVEEVLKKRQVKRNTILVGLSNKKYFQKHDRDRYTLATAQ
ncbi:MAG: hypothetical protein HYW51_02015 [Candidatus Doudnabacteria bacterium]|nr:hypothetical protein [Candidatus Doudnabacteria bacterium]